MPYGTTETFFTAEELVLGEVAHSRVGVAESVHLAEEVREAGRVRLTNLLNSVLVESRGRERLARVLEGREGIDRPSRLREPSDEFDPVELQGPRGLVSVREALSDEDGGTGAENAAELVRGDWQVWDVVNDKGEPCGVCRCVWQR
jgi:hypothetical protein